MTDVSIMVRKKTLLNTYIHDVHQNLITMSRQVKRAITAIGSTQTRRRVCFISKPVGNLFFPLILFGFHFLPLFSPYSPPLTRRFYPSVIVHV